jgi:hypothetical protein
LIYLPQARGGSAAIDAAGTLVVPCTLLIGPRAAGMVWQAKHLANASGFTRRNQSTLRTCRLASVKL